MTKTSGSARTARAKSTALDQKLQRRLNGSAQIVGECRTILRRTTMARRSKPAMVTIQKTNKKDKEIYGQKTYRFESVPVKAFGKVKNYPPKYRPELMKVIPRHKRNKNDSCIQVGSKA